MVHLFAKAVVANNKAVVAQIVFNIIMKGGGRCGSAVGEGYVATINRHVGQLTILVNRAAAIVDAVACHIWLLGL